MDVINVDLYGGKGIFGGRETPLEAAVISCDRYEQCSYFQNNQCLNVCSFLSPTCKYGRVSNVKGYTSRAAKHHAFRDKWRKHEKYDKLVYPPQKIGVIGDEIVFPYPYITIRKKEEDYLLDSPGFGSSIAFIEKENFTIDLIKRICDFRPRSIMGSRIIDYQEKIVPLFLAHLKEVLPDIYAEYAEKYGLTEKSINYVGRKALLKTILPSDVFYKNNQYPNLSETWHWDGQSLLYSKGHISKVNITKDYEIETLKIIPSDKSTIVISDNEQISKETIFID